MYLLDTNIWLERLLERERAADVARLLDEASGERLAASDFTLYSLGIILTRLGRSRLYLDFTRDAFVEGDVALLRLEPDDQREVVRTMHRYRLDYDDAYQYVTAEKNDLVLVSFDADFDRTDRGRMRPADLA